MSPLRVIGGRARGRLLRMPSGATRPTSQKVRAAVFSMLEAQLWRLGEGGWGDVRVLDLFAGSGAYGIEALSRGAAWADFVEEDAHTCRVIRENLARAGYVEEARVFASDAIEYLRRLAPGPLPYAIILADPPYGYPRLAAVLAEIAARGPASRAGFVVVESGRQDVLPEGMDGLAILRQRVHGDTKITLYLWRPREAEDGDETPTGRVSRIVRSDHPRPRGHRDPRGQALR